MSHVRCCTIAVVGQNIEENRGAAGTVSLVHNFLVIAPLRSAEPLLDGTVDVILRDIVCLCFRERKFETHIPRGITAAHTHGDRDLSADLRRDFAADGVVCALFTLYIRPL